MSASLAKDMDNQLQERSKFGLISMFVFPLIILLGDDIFKFIVSFTSDSHGVFNFDNKKLAENVVVIAVDFSAAILAMLSRAFNLHRKIDSATFTASKCVGCKIRKELINVAKRLTDSKGAAFDNVGIGDCMRLFYSFANKQEELRKHSFYYWENYYFLILLMFFSFSSAVLCFYLVFFTETFSSSWIIACIPLMFTGISAYEARYSLYPKMIEHAIEQIRMAEIETPAELKKQIAARFS